MNNNTTGYLPCPEHMVIVKEVAIGKNIALQYYQYMGKWRSVSKFTEH